MALGSVAFRGATHAIDSSSFLNAAVTLVVSQVLQTVLLGVWLLVRDPVVVRRVYCSLLLL